MNNLIIDHFAIIAPNFYDICDSSLDPNVVNPRLREYYERLPIEAVYRTLYRFGFINNNKKWVKSFNQENGCIYFILSIASLIKNHPELKELMPQVLSEEAKEIWQQMIK